MLRWLHRLTGTTEQQFAEPNIAGGERVAWSAAIVVMLVWIALAIWLGVLMAAAFEKPAPPCSTSSATLVGAGFFLKG